MRILRSAQNDRTKEGAGERCSPLRDGGTGDPSPTRRANDVRPYGSDGGQMKKRFRLWALPYGPEAMEAAYRERFCRVGADYVLIYAARKPKLPCAEVTEQEAHRLTGAETKWLLDCNLTLIAEETQRRSVEILADMSRKLDELEAALKRQQEIENGEAEQTDE